MIMPEQQIYTQEQNELIDDVFGKMCFRLKVAELTVLLDVDGGESL